jgi:hypothetical protein
MEQSDEKLLLPFLKLFRGAGYGRKTAEKVLWKMF